jgi:hypothetical protein
MRLFLSVLVAYLTFCVPVRAQETDIFVETDETPVLQTNAPEGAGLLVNDTEGALPKGLWRLQPRSEITYLLKTMPAEAPFRSLQEIKRNLLISTYDTGEIENDVTLAVGEDLLTLRLLKLLQMGLWDDAFQFYTNTTKDPGQNEALAQIGILLIFHQKGLSTACLEEKAFGPRFAAAFWRQFDLLCAAELGGETGPTPQFPESSFLTDLYADPSFRVSAGNMDLLAGLSFLELAILNYKNRLDYTDFTPTEAYPPYIIKTFMEDKQFPPALESQLQAVARFHGLLPEKEVVRPEYPPEGLENAGQDTLVAYVTPFVERDEQVPLAATERLRELSAPHPENIFYLQLLEQLGLTENSYNLPDAITAKAQNAFPQAFSKEVNLLKTWLDNGEEFSNNPGNVYEKQLSLTSDGVYGTSSDDWTQWLGKTTAHQFAGLSLLIVLNNNDNKGARSQYLLSDLQQVGLIEQAHLIARDMLVRLMHSNT